MWAIIESERGFSSNQLKANISFTKEVSTIIYAKAYHEAVSSFHDLLFARIYAEYDYIIVNVNINII